MNFIHTTQYESYQGYRIIVEMVRGFWLWTVNDSSGVNVDISEHKFESPKLAFDDAKEFIDALKTEIRAK
jgi:hypothetical protein